MVAGVSGSPRGPRLRCRPMHGPCSRRVAGVVVCCVAMVGLAACTGGGAKSGATSGGTNTVDVKSACAALHALQHSGDVLNGINVADPDTSTAALNTAVTDYSAALLAFEQVGPLELRATAAAMRADVIAHHFGNAATARTAISAWNQTHCS
jgi:hypothetical protein